MCAKVFFITKEDKSFELEFNESVKVMTRRNYGITDRYARMCDIIILVDNTIVIENRNISFMTFLGDIRVVSHHLMSNDINFSDKITLGDYKHNGLGSQTHPLRPICRITRGHDFDIDLREDVVHFEVKEQVNECYDIDCEHCNNGYYEGDKLRCKLESCKPLYDY